MLGFLKFLVQLRHGEALDEYEDQFKRLVGQCLDTRKKGELSIKLSIEPIGQSNELKITDQVVIKIPKRDAWDTRFFLDAGGDLAMRFPGRGDADPDIVDSETGEVRAADDIVADAIAEYEAERAEAEERADAERAAAALRLKTKADRAAADKAEAARKPPAKKLDPQSPGALPGGPDGAS